MVQHRPVHWEDAVCRPIGPEVWRHVGRGARLGLVGSVHGDEPAGAEVIRELVDSRDGGWGHEVWEEGPDADVTLAIGNPRALELGMRGTLGGRDLNRLFGETEPDGDTYEEERARRLRAELAAVRRLVDLHQTACPTPPLAVGPSDPDHLAFAAALGLEVVVAGVEEVYGGAMVSEWIDRRGGLGLAVETGAKGTPEALAVAREVARRLVSGARAEPGAKVRVYQVEEALPSPGPGLRFLRPLGNTSPVRAGEVLGISASGEVRVPRDGAVFLPRESALPGEPCLLLARDLGWVEAVSG